MEVERCRSGEVQRWRGEEVERWRGGEWCRGWYGGWCGGWCGGVEGGVQGGGERWCHSLHSSEARVAGTASTAASSQQPTGSNPEAAARGSSQPTTAIKQPVVSRQMCTCDSALSGAARPERPQASNRGDDELDAMEAAALAPATASSGHPSILPREIGTEGGGHPSILPRPAPAMSQARRTGPGAPLPSVLTDLSPIFH